MRHASYKGKSSNFRFNPFNINYFFNNQGQLYIFSQSVKDFYIEGQLTSTSITIAECALFLKQDTNKTNFFIEKA